MVEKLYFFAFYLFYKYESKFKIFKFPMYLINNKAHFTYFDKFVCLAEVVHLRMTVHLLDEVLQIGLEVPLQCLREAHPLIVLLLGAVLEVDLLKHLPAVPHITLTAR